MERIFKFLLVAALVSAVAIQAGTTPVVSYYKARPQSFNSARKVSGEVGHTHLFDMEEWYGTFWVAPSYTRSFRPERIACCLFGDDIICDSSCGSTLKIQGSAVENRDPKAWLADYFYLPDEFDGSISFEPRISNFIVDLNLYLGLDEWVKGLYFRLYGPFVHTRWDLNFKECAPTLGNNIMLIGKFSPKTIESGDLLQTAAAFFEGQAPTSPLSQTVTYGNPSAPLEATFSIELKPLCCGRFSGSKCSNSCKGRRTENGFGEVRAELGWNFWQDEDYHFGLNIQGAAPTGTRPESCYLFDAIVGNGKHWEVGGGATGHYIFWRSEDEEKHFGGYMDLNVTHLFNARQRRCLDLCCKPLSRYMLAAKHTTDVTNKLGGEISSEELAPSNYQFAGIYEPVGNLTMQDVKVSVGAQVDLSAWFNYTSGGFSWDLGYNFWYSSCEKFKCSEKCPPRLHTETLWALKGDARAFGYYRVNESDIPLPVALAFSQKDATINKGTNQGKTVDADNPDNGGVDAAKRATSHDNFLLNGTISDEYIYINLSFPPTFIKESDINYQSSRVMSHKVFTHCAYTWNREGWVPYLGIGGEVEFGRTDCCKKECNPCATTCCPPTCEPCCSDCIDCALSQWGVWLKAGISFD